MDLKLLILHLILSIAVGVKLSFDFVRESEVGRRYFLYHGLGAVGLASGVCLLIGTSRLAMFSKPWLTLFLTAGALHALTAGWLRPVSLTASVASSVSGLVLLAANTVSIPHAILSSLLLGFSMAAMLLGHWYLVQPKLSINELRRISLALILVIVLRLVFASVHLLAFLWGRPEAEVSQFFLSSTPGIFLLMRWAWGLVGPMVTAHLIWGTVRIRSTQSATGILYVTVLAILTGETMSHFLLLRYGIIS